MVSWNLLTTSIDGEPITRCCALLRAWLLLAHMQEMRASADVVRWMSSRAERIRDLRSKFALLDSECDQIQSAVRFGNIAECQHAAALLSDSHKRAVLIEREAKDA